VLTSGLVAAQRVYWILWLIYRSNGLRSCLIQQIPSTPGKPRLKTALRWRVHTFGVQLCSHKRSIMILSALSDGFSAASKVPYSVTPGTARLCPRATPVLSPACPRAPTSRLLCAEVHAAARRRHPVLRPSARWASRRAAAHLLQRKCERTWAAPPSGLAPTPQASQ